MDAKIIKFDGEKVVLFQQIEYTDAGVQLYIRLQNPFHIRRIAQAKVFETVTEAWLGKSLTHKDKIEVCLKITNRTFTRPQEDGEFWI